MALKGIENDFASTVKQQRYCMTRSTKPFMTREDHLELHGSMNNSNTVYSTPKVGSFALAAQLRKAAQNG